MARTLVIFLAVFLAGCQASGDAPPKPAAADELLAAFRSECPAIGTIRAYPAQTFRDGYSGRLDFRDVRLSPTTTDDTSDWTADGGMIEVYPSVGSAISRRDALVRVASQEGRAPERIYLYGTALMRLSPRFTSEQANAYEASFREAATHPK